VIIGDRLRDLREEKHLSQGDIEKRTGLLRCYISRVENGHTVPAIETLEKLARAMEIPLYQLFYDGEEPPAAPFLPKARAATDIEWGSVGKDARMLSKLRRMLGAMDKDDRNLLLFMVQKMAGLKAIGLVPLPGINDPIRRFTSVRQYERAPQRALFLSTSRINTFRLY